MADRVRRIALVVAGFALFGIPANPQDTNKSSAPAPSRETYTYKTVGACEIKADVYRLPGNEDRPLYLSLGLTVALFFIGGIHDWRGEAAARALLPWAVGIGASFFAVTQLLGGAFLIFVVYEATAMVATLAMYVFLSTTGRLAGAGMISVGIGLSIVAAAVQASALSVRLIVPFDHNGLFHLVQLIATAAFAAGLRRGLETHGWQAA